MLILGIIILFIIGFLTIHLISIRFSTSEKAGLAFPVGLGLETGGVDFVIDVLGEWAAFLMEIF